MLKIVDLNRNEELSASEMRKVAGGDANLDNYLSCEGPTEALMNGLFDAADFFSAAGFQDAADMLTNQGVQVGKRPC
jgi:hypothetical protein